MNYIRLDWVKAACAACAHEPIQPFSIRRVRSSFDWIPERHRFAFSRER